MSLKTLSQDLKNISTWINDYDSTLTDIHTILVEVLDKLDEKKPIYRSDLKYMIEKSLIKLESV